MSWDHGDGALLCDIDEAPARARGTVEPDDPRVSVTLEVDGERTEREHGSADIGWAVLEDAEVRAKEPMVWLHDRIAADATWRAGEDAFPLGPGIRRRGDRLHHDLDRVPGTLDGGRFLTSFHAAGWAHWVLDVLPRLVVDAELPPDLHRHPLLVPKFATQRPRYRESLETFVDPDALVGLEHERLTRVRELVWLDGARPFVHKDFRTADVPEGVPLGFHARTMARFREAVRAAHAVGIRPDPDRRIQLVRRDGARNEASRRHNDAELEAVARREGFEAFVLERLPFAEQVALLASAGCIVGPYGAAWTLSFFSAPGARALMVRPRSMVQRWLYPTLARISGLELRALEFVPQRSDPRGARVDPERFREALRDLIDGP